MNGDEMERMKAIVAQISAELTGRCGSPGAAEVHLVVYGVGMDEAGAAALFAEASQGTPVEGVRLVVRRGAQQYICWSCCGLRFEADDGVCPNCGEEAIRLPDTVTFGIREIRCP